MTGLLYHQVSKDIEIRKFEFVSNTQILYILSLVARNIYS